MCPCTTSIIIAQTGIWYVCVCVCVRVCAQIVWHILCIVVRLKASVLCIFLVPVIWLKTVRHDTITHYCTLTDWILKLHDIYKFFSHSTNKKQKTQHILWLLTGMKNASLCVNQLLCIFSFYCRVKIHVHEIGRVTKRQARRDRGFQHHSCST